MGFPIATQTRYARVCPAAGDEGEEFGFDRGSKRSYELEVGDALGTLRSVFVQQVISLKTALATMVGSHPLTLA